MCGITGIYKFPTSREPVKREILDKMTDLLSHRGPDGEGAYINNESTVGLGHRRLSIIDLSGGHQPMLSWDGRYVVVFNGEIYNFRELKVELSDNGGRFVTNSDTEIILEAYRAWGKECVKKFNGIFAFALLDTGNNTLFMARDHIGVKPLYYYRDGKSLVFASEIKSILSVPEIRTSVSVEVLNELFTFRYVQSPGTLFSNIFKMEPASYMFIDGENTEYGYYWENTPVIGKRNSFKYYCDRYEQLLYDAVKRQMISDVPIGLSLSSGVDSSLLLAIMSKLSSKPVLTFTVGFEGGDYNENEEARNIARTYNAEHHEMIIKAVDYIDFFEKYIWYLEEPIGNESAPAYYYVAKSAKEKVKVLLNGQGIDELMAGYPRHKGERYSGLFNFIPKGIWRGISTMKDSFRNERLDRMFYSLRSRDMLSRFKKIYSITESDFRKKLFKKEQGPIINDDLHKVFKKYFDRYKTNDGLSKMLYIDVRTSLPDNLLLCEDKMSMAASIEARVPYLDIELVKFIENLPVEHKLRLLSGKFLHKKVAGRRLEPNIIRRKKMGFITPMDKWLQHHLKEYFNDLVFSTDSLTSTYLNSEYVRDIYSQHDAGKRDYRRFLYLLLSTEIWYNRFFKREVR